MSDHQSEWTPKRAQEIKKTFYVHLGKTWVKSKEKGYIILGQHLLDSQVKVIETVFDGLGRGIHNFKVLKSRQLGVSTVVRSLVIFWNGIFEVTSALVFDTGEHLEEARLELLDMLERMPPSYKFPGKARDNRSFLGLKNGSRVNMLKVGSRKSAGSGGLGAGSGIAVAHRSELCGYGDMGAVENLRHSFSRTNPVRLFIDESTARGFNIWNEIWMEAKEDPDCICLFIGWWSHQYQKIERSHPDFTRYTAAPLSEEERSKIKEVKERYGHEITAEQLAWIRKEMDPLSAGDDGETKEFSSDTTRLQNQPWTEDDAFQQTGSVFFAPESLTKQSVSNVSNKYSPYFFVHGQDFPELNVFQARAARQTQLKIWEEPVPEACYILAADGAYGRSAGSDRSAIQLLRAYSDGLDQVAEFAWQEINPQQFAWVIMALEAWYGQNRAQIFRIIEINGSGDATWRELMQMRQKINAGYFTNQGLEGLQDIQRNVKNYIFSRSDSQHPGQSWQLKTAEMLKVSMMERLSSFVGTNSLILRSQSTIDEMRSIERDGDTIEAIGSKKDDRVVSLAFGVRMWDDRVRQMLMKARRSRASEEAGRRRSIVDQVKIFNEAQFSSFLATKTQARRNQALANMRAVKWGGRR